jgi:hypothetical protein
MRYRKINKCIKNNELLLSVDFLLVADLKENHSKPMVLKI